MVRGDCVSIFELRRTTQLHAEAAMTNHTFGSQSSSVTNLPSNELAVTQRIGFVGLGRMGSAMAANLAASDFGVVGFVRHPDEMDRLVKLGISPTIDMADLFGCDIVVSMLPDDAAVRAVVFGPEGLARGMKPGAIHLSMSTISTEAASSVAKEHVHQTQGYVAAPVFGNPDAARERQLFIIAAGAESDVARCRPLLEQLGQRIFTVGEDPAHANLVKLFGNMMTATTLEVLGETIAALRRRGLDPQLFVDILTNTMFAGRAHKIYGNRIVHQDYAPGFAMPLAFKDVRLALAEAKYVGVPMPSVEVVRDRMMAGIARGHADLDWSGLGLIADEEASAARVQAPAIF
jgi:3-hydroxyisobutyrate dehydrogenase-like beta-hydroxyacid dehydrogenase